MKYLKYILPLLFIVGFSNAQEKKGQSAETTDIKSIVESRRFEFVAESASPMRGRTINLSPGYTFTSTPDTIIGHLPYFGRAYQAPFNPDDAGIKFTSTDFTYSVEDRKKGGWNINIKPKDIRNSPLVNISVSPSGYASVNITSTDREAISFKGFIKKED